MKERIMKTDRLQENRLAKKRLESNTEHFPIIKASISSNSRLSLTDGLYPTAQSTKAKRLSDYANDLRRLWCIFEADLTRTLPKSPCSPHTETTIETIRPNSSSSRPSIRSRLRSEPKTRSPPFYSPSSTLPRSFLELKGKETRQDNAEPRPHSISKWFVPQQAGAERNESYSSSINQSKMQFYTRIRTKKVLQSRNQFSRSRVIHR